MPVWYVRSVPSTYMTSVQQWLDLVSGLEGLLFVPLRPFRWPPLLPLLPYPPPYTWEQQVEAPKRLCPIAWLPGSCCSENLS